MTHNEIIQYVKEHPAGKVKMALADIDGVLRVYDPATRSFGAYNRDGTTRTFFKPGRRNYFADQPGTPVNLKEQP